MLLGLRRTLFLHRARIPGLQQIVTPPCAGRQSKRVLPGFVDTLMCGCGGNVFAFAVTNHRLIIQVLLLPDNCRSKFIVMIPRSDAHTARYISHDIALRDVQNDKRCLFGSTVLTTNEESYFLKDVHKASPSEQLFLLSV